MKMTLPPEATFGRLPLEGAPLTARQSRFRGGPGMAFLFACATGLAEVI
jgi:hypothetical protein